MVALCSTVAALDFPKIIEILNKYNSAVEQYEQLNDVYNSLKGVKISEVVNNTKKLLDGQFSELADYIIDIKDDTKKTEDEDGGSLLEKTGKKLLDVNETLNVFEKELDKYIN